MNEAKRSKAPRFQGALRILIAAAALALMLLPGEVWSRPQSDLDQRSFDPGLLVSQTENRFLFDPFLILDSNWQPCPCPPGTELSITGQPLADATTRGSSPGVVEVLVNDRPAQLTLVTPLQVNFILPQDVDTGVAAVALQVNNRILGRDTVAVGTAGSAGHAAISASTDALDITAAPGGEPAVHLLTSPLSFRTEFDATIQERSGSAVPLRLMFWDPRTASSFDLLFGADGTVKALLLESRGRIGQSFDLGTYQVGTPYHVAIEWTKDESAAITVSGPDGVRGAAIDAKTAPALFSAYRPSLTAVASAHDGASSTTLTNYHLTLPHERFTTIRTDDAKIPPLVLALSIAGLALLLVAVLAGRRSLRFPSWRPRVSARACLGLATLGLAYAGFNAFLFSLGSQPFDMGSQKIWAYIAAGHGMGDLYYMAQTASLAEVWRGTPYHEAVFPYNFGMAYYFGAIGRLHQLFFGNATPDSMSLEVMIKAFNLAFMIADAALVYAIVRALKPAATRLPWVAAALVLFNPAFIFDTSVWGETESVPLFFLLASVLATIKDRPGLAWTLLAAAFLTKQTAAIPVVVLGVYYLLHFDWRRNLDSIATALVLVLAASLPFTLNGYPPSIAIDPTLAALWVHGGTGAEKIFQTTSYDAFNLWTLASAFSQGAHGLARFQAQDYVPRLGDWSYHDAGNVLLISAILGLLGWLLLNARRLRQAPDAMVLVLALAFLAELVLPTRTLSRYFIFPMVFAVAALAGSGRRWPVLAVVLALTTTSLVGSYGSMAIVLDSFPEHAPALDPHTNPLSALMMHLFRSDAFITAAGLLNLASLLTMAAVLVLERRSPQVRSQEAASPRFETRRGLATPPMIPFRGHPDLP